MSNRWRMVVAGYGLFLSALIVIASVGGTVRTFGFVQWLPYGDKLCHFLLLGMLALLWDLGMKQRNVRVLGLSLPLAPALVVLIASVEELSQRLLPSTRTFDLLDLAANVSGALLLPQLARSGLVPRRLLAIEASP